MSDPTVPAPAPAPRRTPLYDLHVELGGKLVDFAGWSLPVQYPAGIMAEHRHCRTAAALFDVSHMAQALIRGAGAAEAFERLVPGDVAGLAEGGLRYTVFTNERGGTLDDLIAGRVAEGLFVVANAARRAADLAHLRQALEPEHPVEELADRALLALQGPRAAEVLGRLCPSSTGLAFMHAMTADDRRALLPDLALRLHRRGRVRDLGRRRRCGGAGPPAARGARGGAGRPGRARLAAPRGGPCACTATS